MGPAASPTLANKGLYLIAMAGKKFLFIQAHYLAAWLAVIKDLGHLIYFLVE